MTTSAIDVLGPDGPVARRIDGFEHRPQQIEMADAVEAALAQRGRLLVEAGTGVGKSFAYLLPAIRRVVEHHERVVIATHTINLQEQLIEKDIPLLNAVIPEEFTAVLVKGRGNYVSLRRLRRASERQDRLFADDEARHSLHVLEDWAYETDDGSLASLPQPPRAEVWDHVQSDAHNCLGRRCDHYKECFYQAARRRMERGDLLVTNHALFFADLAMRAEGGGFLPPYDHVILDEAHCAEPVAAEHFGLSLAESQVGHLLRMLYDPRRRRGVLDAIALKEDRTEPIDRAIEAVLAARAAAGRFFDDLERWAREHGPGNGRVREAGIVADELGPALARLGERLRLLKPLALREADEYEINGYAVRADDLARRTAALVGQGIEGCVYFVEGHDATRRRRRMVLRAMAVDVAPILRERLFGGGASVVMTSATLATAAGDFGHAQRSLGCEGAETRQLGSPFVHARQMRVLVDHRMPAPGDRGYVEALVPRIESLVRRTDGGAFVLFTSFAMLREAAEALREPLASAGHPVLVQGDDGPPGLVLRRFRDDPRSVLFGTASFWQGVDVRGEALRNVIITRLPFEVPDHPVVEARHERLRAAGRNPFSEDQVPRAVIRFRQGVGRLIRSATDRGIVAVLDPRIVTKHYGRAFQAALPDGVEVEPIEDPAEDAWVD